ncbi:MAG: rhodanese-like domain-containing protein [Saprospiraceae bacterium]|nr:rhodanese-like domain-containing protein [Saprospiraceae bacterium]
MTLFNKMTAREAYAAYFSGSLLVNVSENPRFANKDLDVKHVLHIPFSQMPKRMTELPKDRNVVLISGVGNKGKHAAEMLLSSGFDADRVAFVEGGMAAWEEEGLPVHTQA